MASDTEPPSPPNPSAKGWLVQAPRAFGGRVTSRRDHGWREPPTSGPGSTIAEPLTSRPLFKESIAGVCRGHLLRLSGRPRLWEWCGHALGRNGGRATRRQPQATSTRRRATPPASADHDRPRTSTWEKLIVEGKDRGYVTGPHRLAGSGSI